MTEAMLKAWISANLKPLLIHAARVMPLRTLGSTLIGYGISCARGDGMTAEEIRSEIVEVALASTRPD